MKVALVHDYLNQSGGAEIVLRYMHSIFPDAPVYTLIYEPEHAPSDFKDWDIRPVGWSNYLPFLHSMFRNYILLYPTMVEQIDVSKYDLVLSSSYLWSKGVITKSETLHVCYCHTPMRQAWELYFDYKHSYSRWIRKSIYPFAFNYIRMWDKLAADRVDKYIANSNNTRKRIDKFYRRYSELIYPPVESSRYYISSNVQDYYICLSRLVPYKKIDLAVEAFNRLGKKLIVIGDGNHLGYLKRIAKPNIEFVGFMDTSEKAKLLSEAKALIFPGDEDFGIVPVEAQMCGRPVICYGNGGCLETVEDHKTGIFFNNQTVDDLISAVNNFEKVEDKFDSEYIREKAMRFDKDVFIDRLRNFVMTEYEKWSNR